MRSHQASRVVLATLIAAGTFACSNSAGLSSSKPAKQSATPAVVGPADVDQSGDATTGDTETLSPSTEGLKTNGSVTAPDVPEFTTESFKRDVAVKFLAAKAYDALANNDPRVAQKDGFLEVIAEAAIRAGLPIEDAKAAILQNPTFQVSNPAQFPTAEEAKRSSDAIKGSLLANAKISDAPPGASTSQVDAFSKLGSAYDAAVAKVAEDAARAQAAQGDAAAATQAAREAEMKTAADRAALEKIRNDLLVLQEQARLAQADAAKRAATTAIYQGSNGIGWLLTDGQSELSGMQGIHTVGYAPKCGSGPNVVPAYRNSFIHQGVGWVYNVGLIDEVQGQLAGSAWQGPAPTFCVFKDPEAGTVPLRKFCNPNQGAGGGTVYYAGAGGPPGDGPRIPWVSCSQVGYIYPIQTNKPLIAKGCYRIGGTGYWSNGSGQSCAFLGAKLKDHCGTSNFEDLGQYSDHAANRDVGACRDDIIPKGCYRIGGTGYWSNGTGQSCAFLGPTMVGHCGTSDFNALSHRFDHGDNADVGACHD